MLGKLLRGHYQVVRVLSAGGFGQTYIAKDIDRPGHPDCVVKHLKPASNNPSFLETARRLFKREAEILEQLGKHDQIPRLLAYFEEDQEFYLVQDFIKGQPLNTELPPGHRWSESKVIQLLQDVSSILNFVHCQGVIHRDVKPNNLIRRQEDGRLVLIDFGAVKQIREPATEIQTQPNSTATIIGTKGYMPLEQVRGKPRPNSDIYALGMIGIQALTGVEPFQLREDAKGELIWQYRGKVSEGLAVIVCKMVSYHFKDRYQSTSQVLQALQPLVNFHVNQQLTPEAKLSQTKVILAAERRTLEAEEPETKIAPNFGNSNTKVVSNNQLQETKAILKKRKLTSETVAGTQVQAAKASLNAGQLDQEMPNLTLGTPKLIDGRYRVVETLSDRVFSQTYIAENIHQQDKPRYIVKRLLKSVSGDPTFLQTAQRLFQSEVETLQKLGEHDQIPQLLAEFEENQAFYLVQEFIEGQPLSAELLPESRWQESQVVQLLQEVLNILAFVHSQGVIHRDIKPDNMIRRQQDNHLVLVDFGAVKQIQVPLNATQGQIGTTVPIGTPGYMPTEQGRGKPRPSSDLYGLGMVCIQALTGLHPTQLLEDQDTGEILWQQEAEVSEGLAAILTKMIRYHFKDRYQTATEALQALNQLSTMPTVQPTISRHWMLIVAGLGTAVAAVAIAAVSWWAFVHPKEPKLNEKVTPTPIPESPKPKPNDNPWKGDYSKLQKSLQQKDWEAADLETYKVMLKVAGPKSQAQGRFDLTEWAQFSCPALKKIDSLWSEASSGKLGFGVQNRVLEESKNYTVSYVKIGWMKESPEGHSWEVAWNYDPETKVVEYHPGYRPNFDNPPDGHLPAKLEWETPLGEEAQDRRFEAIYRCNL
ncbi:MAG: protein kinase [Symploca sp. SIO2E9]|nr:protein kinase [Symploca sp. SIO2E9]